MNGIWIPIEHPETCIDCYISGLSRIVSCPCISNGIPGLGTNRPVPIPEDCPIKEISSEDVNN